MDISIFFIVMVKINIFGGVPSIININAVRVLQVAKMKQVISDLNIYFKLLIIVLYKYHNKLTKYIN